MIAIPTHDGNEGETVRTLGELSAAGAGVTTLDVGDVTACGCLRWDGLGFVALLAGGGFWRPVEYMVGTVSVFLDTDGRDGADHRQCFTLRLLDLDGNGTIDARDAVRFEPFRLQRTCDRTPFAAGRYPRLIRYAATLAFRQLGGGDRATWRQADAAVG